jgi:hypothetical protein
MKPKDDVVLSPCQEDNLLVVATTEADVKKRNMEMLVSKRIQLNMSDVKMEPDVIKEHMSVTRGWYTCLKIEKK